MQEIKSPVVTSDRIALIERVMILGFGGSRPAALKKDRNCRCTGLVSRERHPRISEQVRQHRHSGCKTGMIRTRENRPCVARQRLAHYRLVVVQVDVAGNNDVDRALGEFGVQPIAEIIDDQRLQPWQAVCQPFRPCVGLVARGHCLDVRRCLQNELAYCSSLDKIGAVAARLMSPVGRNRHVVDTVRSARTDIRVAARQ